MNLYLFYTQSQYLQILIESKYIFLSLVLISALKGYLFCNGRAFVFIPSTLLLVIFAWYCCGSS